MQLFKQNETNAAYRRIYMFLASPSDGYTPVTLPLSGATVNLFKNGAPFASQPLTPQTLTHISAGHWYYDIPAIYLTDLGILTVTVSDTNIRPVVLMAQVVSYDWTQATGPTAADIWSYTTRALTAGAITSTTFANSAINLRLANDPIASSARFTTNDSFSGYPVLSNGPQFQIAITGAHHAAADVHEFQPNVLTSTATDTTFNTEIADAIWDDLTANHTIANTFGKLMDDIRKSNYSISGTVSTVSSASSFTSSLLGYVDGAFDHQTLVFTDGVLVGESKPILDFIGASGTVNMEEVFSQAPSVGDAFVVLPQHVHAIEAMIDGFLNRLLDSSGSSVDQLNERTVRSALRAMRNKVVVNGGTITVHKEDDAATAWTGSISNTADVTVNPTGGS